MPEQPAPALESRRHSPAGPCASVVIPAYNAAETLPAALHALRRQTYPADLFEVIVVDDGSGDETAAVAGAYGARVLRQANSGPAAARNRGAAAARGQIVLFTDADCIPASSWLERMLAPFADAEVVGVKGAYRTRQRSIVARFAQAEFEGRYRKQLGSAIIDVVDSYSAAFRREAFLAAGGYDERFRKATTEDSEFSYRLADLGARLVFVPDAVVYHTHPATLGRYLRVKFGRGYWMLVVFQMHRRRAVKDSYRPQTMKLQSALAGAALATAPASLVWRPARVICLSLWCALLATTLPFTAFVARRDPLVALFTPAIAVMRAIAIGAGTAAAMLGLGEGLDYSRDLRGSLGGHPAEAEPAVSSSLEAL